MKDLIHLDRGALRWTMLAIIIYGYFLMLILLGMCIFLPIIFCVIAMKSQEEMNDSVAGENDELFENIK